MKISIKHLVLGMSLGAAIVFIYGFNKLKPEVETRNTREPEVMSNTINQNPVDIKEIIEPELTFYLKGDIKNQVQFMELNRFGQNSLGFKNEDITPTPTTKPVDPKPVQIVSEANNKVIINNQQTQIQNAPIDVVRLIEKYATEYGVDKNMMIGIAKCESGFRENAVNGPYAGIYQFVSGTWISNRRAMGLDENLSLRFNAEEATKTAAFKMSRDGFGAWPACQRKTKSLLGMNSEGI